MHMADALISPAVGSALWAASAATIAYSARKLRKEGDDSKIPLMGVLGAFIFAAQMVNRIEDEHGKLNLPKPCRNLLLDI